ncbi:transmembrane protein 174 [Tamandua tetradactyla]|uniref:transmembrane protein 174 n=1 Tax=Tamandua tetradactyla TaxID=48850 RepID=UPI0040542D71
MQHGPRLEDFPLNVFSVTPYTPSTADIQVSDDDKAGATLLFSGIFLGLVGITFTIIGWVRYQGVSHFEWTQLLGPILLSVGVTFILIAVCKFKMPSCQVCSEGEERPPESEQTAGGQSFVFTGINQPITFHGATVVQYMPPPPGAPETLGVSTIHLQPATSPCSLLCSGGAVAATPSPPQYSTIYPWENAASAAGKGDGASEDRSSLGADQLEGQLEDGDCACFSPPSYEEIYPVPPRD